MTFLNKLTKHDILTLYLHILCAYMKVGLYIFKLWIRSLIKCLKYYNEYCKMTDDFYRLAMIFID